MSEKRYFKMEYDEEWYLFDSTTISEQLVKEQAEYGYGVFANSLSPSEVVDLLNTMSDEIEEVGISIKLFEDDVQIKDKKIEEQQVTIEALLLDRDRQEEKLDIARRNMAKQLEKIEELQKKNAQLTERLRECRMRLDKFNCR